MTSSNPGSILSTLTLAEAVTLLAYRRPIGNQRLRDWLTHCGGSFPERVQKRLDKAGRQVANLIYRGQVSAYGEPFHRHEGHGERIEINDKILSQPGFR